MNKDRIYWAENAVGRIYLTTPQSDLQPGYMLKTTTSAKEMDRQFAKLHEQERAENEKRIEKLWSRGKENFDRMRSELRRRMSLHDTSNFEKSIIRASLNLMDEKEAKQQQNTVYGVSAMQEAPEPLPAPRTRVM
jgi:hypothetical protein